MEPVECRTWRDDWRIAVRHRTGYRYAVPVRASYNEARLTPPTVDGQRTLQAALAITPAVRPLRYVDYWGTTVDAFDVDVPHTELVVVATSTVDTVAPRSAPAGIGWTDLATGGPGPLRRATRGFTATFGRSRSSPRSASPCGPDRRPVQAGPRAAEWTHEALRYERGATHVHTSSAQARAAG